MLTVTSKAVEKLKQKLLHTCFAGDVGFRILVSSNESGKSVFSMKLDRQHEGDEVTELDGVKVFLDVASTALVRGYQLDYHDKPSGEFFLLREK